MDKLPAGVARAGLNVFCTPRTRSKKLAIGACDSKGSTAHHTDHHPHTRERPLHATPRPGNRPTIPQTHEKTSTAATTRDCSCTWARWRVSIRKQCKTSIRLQTPSSTHQEKLHRHPHQPQATFVPLLADNLVRYFRGHISDLSVNHRCSDDNSTSVDHHGRDQGCYSSQVQQIAQIEVDSRYQEAHKGRQSRACFWHQGSLIVVQCRPRS